MCSREMRARSIIVATLTGWYMYRGDWNVHRLGTYSRSFHVWYYLRGKRGFGIGDAIVFFNYVDEKVQKSNTAGSEAWSLRTKGCELGSVTSTYRCSYLVKASAATTTAFWRAVASSMPESPSYEEMEAYVSATASAATAAAAVAAALHRQFRCPKPMPPRGYSRNTGGESRSR